MSLSPMIRLSPVLALLAPRYCCCVPGLRPVQTRLLFIARSHKTAQRTSVCGQRGSNRQQRAWQSGVGSYRKPRWHCLRRGFQWQRSRTAVAWQSRHRCREGQYGKRPAVRRITLSQLRMSSRLRSPDRVYTALPPARLRMRRLYSVPPQPLALPTTPWSESPSAA